MAGLANQVPVVTNLGALSEPLWAASTGVAVVPRRDPAALTATVIKVLALPSEDRLGLGARGAGLVSARLPSSRPSLGSATLGAHPPARLLARSFLTNTSQSSNLNLEDRKRKASSSPVGRDDEPVPHHLAILTDFPEEGWRSMDLCGDMLLDHLPRDGPYALGLPAFARRSAGSQPGYRWSASGVPLNADQLLNRFILFPRYARQAARRFDLFHVADHTYAQLVHALPAARTGCTVTTWTPSAVCSTRSPTPGPRWFRAMSQRILSGLRKAAVVFHSTAAVGEEINRVGLIDPDRLVRMRPTVSHRSSPPARPNPRRAAVARRPGWTALGAPRWHLQQPGSASTCCSTWSRRSGRRFPTSG